MATLYITEGVTLIGSSDTVARVQRVMAEERARINQEYADFCALCAAREAWLASRDPEDWSYYSDLHKDVWGVRPTWER